MENNLDLELNLNINEQTDIFLTENQINILFNLLKEELLIRQQLIATTLPLSMPDLTTSSRVMPILSRIGTKYSLDSYQNQQGIQGYLEWLYSNAKESSDFKPIILKILSALENLLPLLEQCRYFYVKSYEQQTSVLSNEDIEYLNVTIAMYISMVQSAIATTVTNLFAGMLTRRKKNLTVKKYNEIYKYISDNQSVISASIEVGITIDTEESYVPQCDLEQMNKGK